MSGQFYNSGGNPGFQYDKQMNNQLNNPINNQMNNQRSISNRSESSNSKRDEDLIIEENTIYEIDRECYERLRKLKRRKI